METERLAGIDAGAWLADPHRRHHVRRRTGCHGRRRRTRPRLRSVGKRRESVRAWSAGDERRLRVTGDARRRRSGWIGGGLRPACRCREALAALPSGSRNGHLRRPGRAPRNGERRRKRPSLRAPNRQAPPYAPRACVGGQPRALHSRRPVILRGRRPPEVGAHHTGVINSARFSPDGRWIVTGGPTAAGIWQRGTGDLLYFVRGHGSAILAVTFAADNRQMFTAGIDGTMRTYRCDLCGRLPALQKLARSDLALAARGG